MEEDGPGRPLTPGALSQPAQLLPLPAQGRVHASGYSQGSPMTRPCQAGRHRCHWETQSPTATGQVSEQRLELELPLTRPQATCLPSTSTE